MVQEAYDSNPAVRDACAESIFGHASTLEADFAAAIVERAPDRGLDARSLARRTQAVLQGAFVLAKAADDPGVALDSIAHLRRYLECIFGSLDATPAST